MRDFLDKFFHHLSEALDISDSQYEQAVNRYMAIAKWLQRAESIVAQAEPDIFPQGSFRLGTMVKPITGEDKFDIDLVCSLQLSKEQITQQQLKSAIGFEIKAYARANSMKAPPQEGRRCWTLKYADGAQFSMDTLPSLPDADSFRILLERKGLSADWTEHAIAITDTEHDHYDIIAPDWLRSNPKGYAAWFKSRMLIQFNERRRVLAAAMLRGDIEQDPEYKVKTPLQRAVQILKRHRDIMFADDSDDKPISIIITTLAGHAYNNENNIVDALINIVEGMPRYIAMEDGISTVRNPVDPTENFADKWQDHPEREENFRLWMNQVRVELRRLLKFTNIHEAGDFLKPRLGERAVIKVLEQFPQPSIALTGMSLAETSTNLPSLFNVPHRKPLRWHWNPKGWVRISGKFSRNGFRPQQFESEALLPKHCSLSFYAKTNITWPYKVYWQVVNTGYEARNANCLRGEFYEGSMEKGGRTRKESTLYSGIHWIECFIVKQGVCLARSGEFVVNIE